MNRLEQFTPNSICTKDNFPLFMNGLPQMLPLVKTVGRLKERDMRIFTYGVGVEQQEVDMTVSFVPQEVIQTNPQLDDYSDLRTDLIKFTMPLVYSEPRNRQTNIQEYMSVLWKITDSLSRSFQSRITDAYFVIYEGVSIHYDLDVERAVGLGYVGRTIEAFLRSKPQIIETIRHLRF